MKKVFIKKNEKKFIIVGVLSFVVSFVFSVNDLSSWHYSQWNAAWVQALGSIAAIMVAIYVPYKIDYNKQVRDELQSKRTKSAAHLLLAREVIEIMIHINAYKVFISHGTLMDDSDVVGFMNPKRKKEIYEVSNERLGFFLSLEEGVMKKYSKLIVKLKRCDVSYELYKIKRNEGSLTSDDQEKEVKECDEIINLCEEIRVSDPN